jgi:hypothetical protein
MKVQAPVGQGLGVQKFSIKTTPGGGLQFDGNAQTPLQAAALAAEPPESATPVERLIADRQQEGAPAAPQTAFSRLYPGVDPSKVEMALDEKSGKIRFRPIEAPPDTAPEPPTPPAAQAPVAPSEPDAIAQLRAEIAQQNQLQSAMLTALMTGRPLMEVLSGAPAKPAEPDYSRFDLEEEEGRTAYAQAVRADAIAAAKAELQAEMRNHLPSIQNANRHGETFTLQAKYGAEPDFQQKSALAMKLAGNNPNVSIEATYNLINQIQAGLGVSPAATPSIKQPSSPILTPAQQAEKAAQAARYQSTNGGRATGPPEPPPEIARNFKKLAHWVAQQQALGNLQ